MRTMLFGFALICGSINAWSTTNPGSLLDLREKPDAVSDYWKTVYRSSPVYPRRAEERGVGGCAVFSYVISADGKAEDLQLVRSMPKKTFVNAAKKAIKKYRWAAVSENLQRQPVLTQQTISFSTSEERFSCDASEIKEPKKRNTSQKCKPTTGSRVGRRC